MIKLLSRLPFCALYAFADFVYFLGFYLARHRHHLINEQLSKVFPALNDAERTTIHKRFLRNFCDVMVEILKSISMSNHQMRARVQIQNLAVARQYLDAGQSVMLVTSHLCNWEWLLQGTALHLGYPVDAAYKPMRDAWAERLLLSVRSRFGARLVPAKDLLTDYMQRRGIVRALAMNADQAPVAADRHQWIAFLGQDTAFYVGAEQIARATRLPMLYLGMRRVRRGYYRAQFKLLWDAREATTPGQLTERYARVCEADVLANPADWLWSYRRWRLQKPLYQSNFS